MRESKLDVPELKNENGKAASVSCADDSVPDVGEWQTFLATLESAEMHDLRASKQRKLDGLIKIKPFEVDDKSSALKRARI